MGSRSKWTDEEDNFLRLNHKRMSSDKLCAHLGRGWYAVQTRMQVLELISEGPSSPVKTIGDPQQLITDCLRLGGFPRAEVINGRTYWLGPDGNCWQGQLAKAA